MKNAPILSKARLLSPLKNAFLASLVAAFILPEEAAADGWTAFNDCVDTAPASTPANATSFGLGRSYAGDGQSGNLLDFATGADTGVTVTFTENFSSGNTINWATDAAAFTTNTDAEEIFGGRLNLTGNMSYNDSPGWSLDVTFTNLDPATAYTFAATIHRNGGAAYANRITNWTITGADSAVYASSAGAHKVNEQSVEFSTGHNPGGLVAKWTGIRPGADGSFTIRTTHGAGELNGGIPGADSYRGYAAGLFMLMAQTESGPPWVITGIEHNKDTGATTLTWPSRAGSTYAVDASDDLSAWREIKTGILAAGETAEYTEPGPAASSGRRYYRVRKLP